MDRFGAILVAAGRGERFGRPKAEVELAGRTLLDRALDAFAHVRPLVAVLRGPPAPPGILSAEGGPRRRDSVRNGLAAMPENVDIVLVHDVARPLVPRAVLDRVMAAARDHACVVPAIPVADTIKRVEGDRVVETLERASLVAVQTPQAFRRGLLQRALDAEPGDATDEAGLVERLGEPVHVVAGAPENLKITVPADLAIAAALLEGV